MITQGDAKKATALHSLFASLKKRAEIINQVKSYLDKNKLTVSSEERSAVKSSKRKGEITSFHSMAWGKMLTTIYSIHGNFEHR